MSAKPHTCQRQGCGGTRGGFRCPYKDRTVCDRPDCSATSSSWIPTGAHLCRVEREYYDRHAPLLGLEVSDQRMRSKLQKELKAALKEVIARIPVIAPGCEIRPTDPRSFYQVRNEHEGLTFDFPTTGLRLRRVAGDDKASLYVALSGTIVFDTEQKTGKPLFHWFSTRVSYFHT